MRVGFARVEPLVLDVAASCPGHQADEYLAEPGVEGYLRQLVAANGRPLVPSGRRVRVPDGTRGLSYQVELGRMALEHDDLNVALRVGNSVLAPGYSWLLSPLGVPSDTSVSVLPRTLREANQFVTGLATDATGYRLRVNELKVATFGVFGQFEQRELRVPRAGGIEADLTLVVLDGELAADRSLIWRWVGETARAVADFYGGFPVERTMLALVPIPDASKVLSGKVLPESGPGIAILVGSNAGTRELYGDWILTHELFHLGFPSFVDEGKWLDEGLATYFEPLIRARQGWLSEQAVWEEFSRSMPRGLSVLERDGLENPSNPRGMYWAGATVCLLADMEAYRLSRGRLGLQDGLRAVLAQGGDATRVWSLSSAIARIDRTLGADIVGELFERYRRPGNRASLSRVFRRLGVRREAGQIVLDDSAPLASVRRAIIRGSL